MTTSGDYNRAASDTVVGDHPELEFSAFYNFAKPLTAKDIEANKLTAWPISDAQKVYLRAAKLASDAGKRVAMKDPEHLAFKISKVPTSSGRHKLLAWVEYRGERIGTAPRLGALKWLFSNVNTCRPNTEAVAMGKKVDKFGNARDEIKSKFVLDLTGIPDTGDAFINKMLAKNTLALLKFDWEMYVSALLTLLENPDERFDGFDPLMKWKAEHVDAVGDAYDPLRAARLLLAKDRDQHPFLGPVTVKARTEGTVPGKTAGIALSDVYISTATGNTQYVGVAGKSEVLKLPKPEERDAVTDDTTKWFMTEFVDRLNINITFMPNAQRYFRPETVALQQDAKTRTLLTLQEQMRLGRVIAETGSFGVMLAIVNTSMPGGSPKLDTPAPLGHITKNDKTNRHIKYGTWGATLIAADIYSPPVTSGGGEDLGDFTAEAEAAMVAEAMAEEPDPQSGHEEDDDDALQAAAEAAEEASGEEGAYQSDASEEVQPKRAKRATSNKRR